MIIVDSLQMWPGGGKFKDFCHLASDGGAAGLAELVEFAGRIGLRVEWLQHHQNGIPHFDLVPSKRRLAVRSGAREVSCRDYVMILEGVK